MGFNIGAIRWLKAVGSGRCAGGFLLFWGSVWGGTLLGPRDNVWRGTEVSILPKAFHHKLSALGPDSLHLSQAVTFQLKSIAALLGRVVTRVLKFVSSFLVA